jgi:hypothetical protein
MLGGGLRAEPLQVILVRHADKDVGRGDPNLSPAGLMRALRLGRLLPACFGPVERLGSYGFNPGSQKNARSYQTAVPLAVATGLPIRLFDGGDDSSPAAPADLLQDPWMERRSVVLVWEHRRLPAMAAVLEWPRSRRMPSMTWCCCVMTAGWASRRRSRATGSVTCCGSPATSGPCHP